MKRRIRKIVNFFAFNLLFFALYLNFIHKDTPAGNSAPVAATTEPAASDAGFTGTVLVQNPEKYLHKEVKNNQSNQQ
jgi:hypothetical protein